jgi:hypothetical protein
MIEASAPGAAARLLARQGRELRQGRLSLADTLAAMQASGFALVLAVLATPNLLPSPGVPLGVVLGIPLLVLALQYAGGAARPRFPARLVEDRRAAAVFGRALRWLAPRLRWWERRVGRRPLGIGERARRWIGGGWIALMAVVIILPVPFGNTLPALSALLIGAALFLDDRLGLGLGLLAGLAGIAYALAVAVGAWELASLAAGR